MCSLERFLILLGGICMLCDVIFVLSILFIMNDTSNLNMSLNNQAQIFMLFFFILLFFNFLNQAMIIFKYIYHRTYDIINVIVYISITSCLTLWSFVLYYILQFSETHSTYFVFAMWYSLAKVIVIVLLGIILLSIEYYEDRYKSKYFNHHKDMIDQLSYDSLSKSNPLYNV